MPVQAPSAPSSISVGRMPSSWPRTGGSSTAAWWPDPDSTTNFTFCPAHRAVALCIRTNSRLAGSWRNARGVRPPLPEPPLCWGRFGGPPVHPFGEHVVERKRRAQPIYPKDLGAILLHADVSPGDLVIEAGTGTGALTIAALRAVGPAGRVVSYELREDFHAAARAAVEEVLGA